MIKYITGNADKARKTMSKQNLLRARNTELQILLKDCNIKTDQYDDGYEESFDESSFFMEGRRGTIQKILEKEDESDFTYRNQA